MDKGRGSCLRIARYGLGLVLVGMVPALAAPAARSGAPAVRKGNPEFTPEQIRLLKTAREDHRRRMKPLEETLRARMKALREAIGAKAPDEEIARRRAAVLETQAAMNAENRRFQPVIAAILTPAQRARIRPPAPAAAPHTGG